MVPDVAAITSVGRPADFSFRHLKYIDVTAFLRDIGMEGARYTRVNGVPERSQINKKFITRSIWLNNNRLRNFKNLDKFVEGVLERPNMLGWIDLSFNHITEIDECLLTFKSLKILYLHGNCISDIEQITKLRKMKQLRSLTLHGNPIANLKNYRNYVIVVLKQLANLDFASVIPTERNLIPSIEATKVLKEITKEEKSVK
ncbi:unnamed protein product [Phaedon cochleariae]|uniref:Leucine-rich repeat-containing protein 51 n=1 Tax=Phaedon cochleariae TaxID=80249 RepID=A0A9N9X181_PHACE|nr:unnamed protein product [Phaedon cochleariae]